jgi:hypothetical protein
MLGVTLSRPKVMCSMPWLKNWPQIRRELSSMPISREEREEYAARRQRVTDHLLECVTSPEIPADLMHFFRLGDWLGIHDLCDKIAERAPRGVKDKDGMAECLIAGALQCLRLAADLERVRTFEKK